MDSFRQDLVADLRKDIISAASKVEEAEQAYLNETDTEKAAKLRELIILRSNRVEQIRKEYHEARLMTPGVYSLLAHHPVSSATHVPNLDCFHMDVSQIYCPWAVFSLILMVIFGCVSSCKRLMSCSCLIGYEACRVSSVGGI